MKDLYTLLAPVPRKALHVPLQLTASKSVKEKERPTPNYRTGSPITVYSIDSSKQRRQFNQP